MITTDPDKAWKVMAYTASENERLKEASGQKRTGQKLRKPVFSYSLSWHPEQQPTRDEMRETALETLRELGLDEHETLIIAHRDEPQPHVHIIVNRVHPITGLTKTLRHPKRILSAFAGAYERKHGKIYCPQRENNHAERLRAKNERIRDSVIQQAWSVSDSGRGFQAALEEYGYRLAKSGKRIVVVDDQGHIRNPARHIDGVTGKDVRARMSDIIYSELPAAESLAEARHRLAGKGNAQPRTKEGKMTCYRDPNIQAAWSVSDSGSSFQAALLERGYELAQGRKRIVAVDPHGKIHNPARHIDGVRAKEVSARLATISRASLPDADNLSREIQTGARSNYDQARQHERKSADILNQMQDQHLEEIGQLREEHARIIANERKELKELYRFDEQQQEIDNLKRQAGRSGRWSKIRAVAARLTERIADKEKSLRNATWRFNERIGGLEKQRDQAMEQLNARQAEERERVVELLAGRKPQEPSKVQEAKRRRRRRGDQTRERERARSARTPALKL